MLFRRRMLDDDARVISAQQLDYYSYTRKNVYCTDAETNGERYSSIVVKRSTILSKSRMHRVKSISHLRHNLLQQQWNDIYKFTYSRIAVDVSLRMYKHGFPSISRNLFFSLISRNFPAALFRKHMTSLMAATKNGSIRCEWFLGVHWLSYLKFWWGNVEYIRQYHVHCTSNSLTLEQPTIKYETCTKGAKVTDIENCT